MNGIQERLGQLRLLMKQRHMDAYLVPTADFHESEYVGEYFKCRQYLTGFTGSAGTAVITESDACLWTDGRYFVQAEAQLQGSGVRLMKMGCEGVPTIGEFLEKALPEGGCLGFDGRVINALTGLELEERLQEKSVVISYGEDLADEIWENRPAMSEKPVWVLAQCYAGESAEKKIGRLRAEMKKARATVHILTSLDDIAWLLNIRGDDVRDNPVALAYAMVTQKEFYLFVNPEILEHPAYPYMDNMEQVTTAGYLSRLGVMVLPYNDIYRMVKELKNQRVLLEKSRVNFSVYRLLDESNRIIDRMNPTAAFKAVKNHIEIENEKRAHIKDGVAVTKFIYWLKTNVGKLPMDEITAADYLEELRRKQDGFLENSFETISAYGEHGAMCHYSATKESAAVLEPKGFYLVDSGGHYYEGTTDITRTIALGPLSAEEKEHFTLVLMSMLRLGDAQFLSGCSGLTVDYAAREVLWKRRLNYDHGTGHGVSYLASVHERPNNIRFRMRPGCQDNAVLEPGMITSDEPGLYLEGKYGIRTENLILCVEREKNEFGQFLGFEYLTFVPIDLDAVDERLMSERDKELLNEYHRQVYETISPYLTEEEKLWLGKATAPIGMH